MEIGGPAMLRLLDLLMPDTGEVVFYGIDVLENAEPGRPWAVLYFSGLR